MAETKNVTIRLGKAYSDFLDAFGSQNQGVKITIDKLQALQKNAMLELKGRFSSTEWEFMANALNGILFDESSRYNPEFVLMELQDADQSESFRKNDFPKLSRTISNLTSAQTDALILRIEKFWSRPTDLETWADW